MGTQLSLGRMEHQAPRQESECRARVGAVAEEQSVGSRAGSGGLLLCVVLAAVGLGGAATVFWFRRIGLVVPVHFRSALFLTSVLFLLGTTLVNVLLRWLRWHFLLRRANIRLATRDSLLIYFACLPALLTPFSIGELIRALLVGRTHPHHRGHVVLVWFLERSSDAIVLSLVALLAGGSKVVLSICLAIWVLTVMLFRGFYRFKGRWLSLGWKALGVCLLLTAASWLLTIAGFWTLTRAAGLGLEPAPSAGIFARATVSGSAFGVPGGAGITGTAMIGELARNGIPESLGVPLVFVVRSGTLWFAIALGVVVAFAFRKRLVSGCAPAMDEHFNEIASEYEEQIPEHVRQRLLNRKIDAMQPWLEGQQLRGLDFGCGQGWYMGACAQSGFLMSGVDISSGQVEAARLYLKNAGHSGDAHVIEGGVLPFEDGTFDFAYTINVVHHILDDHLREASFRELLRVLKPGGQLFMHEINVANPVFRFYMDYIFPALRSIDEGTERWIHPKRLPVVPGGEWQLEVAYFTFLPDFLPAPLLRLLAPLERWLEQSPMKHWSAHYMAVLRKGE